MPQGVASFAGVCGQLLDGINAFVERFFPFSQVEPIGALSKALPMPESGLGALQKSRLFTHAFDHKAMPFKAALIVLLLVHGFYFGFFYIFFSAAKRHVFGRETACFLLRNVLLFFVKRRAFESRFPPEGRRL